MARTLKQLGFFARLGAAIRRFRLVGSAGTSWAWTWGRNFLAGTQVDYEAEAGRVYDNPIVSIGINWTWKQTLTPRLIVEERGKDDEGKTVWIESEDHPLALAFNRAIYYDRTVLLFGTVLSWFVRGNAYWRKIRSRSSDVVGFAYLPHHLVEVRNDKGNDDGSKLVTYYRYRPPGAGAHEDIDPREIVHFRWGIDPENMALGLSPLYAALREIVGENTASTVSTAMMKNAGMSGIAFSPKEGEIAENPNPDQRQEFKEKLKRATTGDMAGEPIVMPWPVDVIEIGRKPNEMAADVLRAINVSRICGAMGIDPMVLGLPSENKTYSNFEEAIEAAYEGAIMPMLAILAIQLGTQCLALDFGQEEGFRVGWDQSGVRALQDDEDLLFTRAGKAYKDDLITKNEARSLIRFKEVPGGDTFYSDALASMAATSGVKALSTAAAARARERRAALEEAEDGGDESGD